jgi:hypothetical protein
MNEIDVIGLFPEMQKLFHSPLATPYPPVMQSARWGNE